MLVISEILAEMATTIPNLEYVKTIKSGKEATVHLVSDGLQPYALKVYKPQQYSTQLEYLTLDAVADKRMQRAIKHRSKAGRRGLQSIWTNREFQIMQDLQPYLPHIPQVFAATANALLQEFIGTDMQPAPRLSDVKLEKDEAETLFAQLVESIKLFLEYGIVHGDLSAYNILYTPGHIYIIDFPQALDIKTNKKASERLNADFTSITNYFEPIIGMKVHKILDHLYRRFLDIKLYG